MKERLVYVDLFKGFAILLVVIGHLLQENTIESANHPLFSLIYSFHMPIFMFISGYMGQKSFKIQSSKDIGNQIYKKAIVLLIPYTVWIFLVNNFFFTHQLPQNLTTQFINLWTSWNQLWFLWFLFVIYLFYSLHQFIIKLVMHKQNLFIDLFIFGFIIGTLVVAFKIYKIYFPLDIDSFILYFIFFFFGVVVSSYKRVSELFLNKYVFFAAMLGFFTLSGHYFFFDLGMENKFIKILISISAIISLYNFTRLNQSSNIFTKRIQIFGINSLVIYVSHFWMLKLFHDVPRIQGIGSFFLILSLTILAIILMETCILIKRLISYSPIMNFLLYGDKTKSS